MDAQLLMDSSALSELVSYAGQYAGFGVGLAVCFWLMGYVVWFVIDLLRGGI